MELMNVMIYTGHNLGKLIKALEFAKEHVRASTDALYEIQFALAVLSSIDEPEKVKTNRKGYKIKILQFYMDKSDDNIIDLVTSGLKYKIIK